jgi:hypothetical protein
MSAEEIAKFREEAKINTNISSSIPQCIQSLPEETPGRENLSKDEWKAAQQTLVSKEFVSLNFPKTVKLHKDPPIGGQLMGLITFIPSKNAVPDNDGCFGVLKLRGNFESEKKCDVMSEYLIRNHDSYSQIDYVWVGQPFPLMADNEAYRLATKEVDIRRKLDEVVRNEIKHKREQEKNEMEEIRQRQEALYRDIEEEKNRTYDDLDFYTQLRVKKATLQYQLDQMVDKKREIDGIISRANIEISSIEKTNPKHKEEFLQRYLDALKSSGVKVEENPLLKYLKD